MTNDRFGSISGLLTSKPPRQATVHPIGVDSRPSAPLPSGSEGGGSRSDGSTDSATGGSTGPRPGRKPRTVTGPKSEESTGGSRRVAFRLEPELHARLVQTAKTSDATHGDVVLDAIETAHAAGRLDQLVTSSQPDRQPSADGLFVRSARRGTAKPTVTVEIQLHAQAVDQLDRLVAEHGAANRTQLIVAALGDHLRAES